METVFTGILQGFFPRYLIYKIIAFKTKLILNVFISFFAPPFGVVCLLHENFQESQA